MMKEPELVLSFVTRLFTDEAGNVDEQVVLYTPRQLRASAPYPHE